MQILRSPAAILASNVIGIDCKGFATFVNGIADAYRRNTRKDFEVYYRFASYDPFDSTPQHVFAVVNENGVEYWIDPVLDQFDERKQPYYFKDKKIKNMALVAMSGIPAISGTKTNTMGNWFNDLLKASPDIIKSFTPTGGGMQPSGGYGGGYYPVQYQQPSTGMNQNTMLILGAAGILAVILLTKKR
jgi:LPXTG-motif cell wall-anchored protein